MIIRSAFKYLKPVANFFIPLVFICGCFVHAATGQKTNITKTIKSADMIVYGVFVSVNTEWRGNKIFTQGLFDIRKTIKGKDLKSIQVEYPGGTALHPVIKAPVTMKTSSSVTFAVEEELILMLRLLPNGNYQINGSKGKLSIVLNTAKNTKLVSGLKKIHASSATEGDKNITISSELMTLDEFVIYVNQEVLK